MKRVLFIVLACICMACNRTTLWSDGIVSYSFDKNVSETDRDKIRLDMDIWEEVTDERIIFVESESDSAVHIKRSDCYSATIGRNSVADNFIEYSVYWSEAIQHEIGHVLGLDHEHQRPDRDAYITVDMVLVKRDNKEHDYGKEDRFRFYDYSLYEYDYRSIMHYENDAYLQAPEDLGERTISATDIQKIEDMYSEFDQDTIPRVEEESL